MSIFAAPNLLVAKPNVLYKCYFEDAWCTEFTWSSTSRRPTTMQTKHKESLAANGESGIKKLAKCFIENNGHVFLTCTTLTHSSTFLEELLRLNRTDGRWCCGCSKVCLQTFTSSLSIECLFKCSLVNRLEDRSFIVYRFQNNSLQSFLCEPVNS